VVSLAVLLAAIVLRKLLDPVMGTCWFFRRSAEAALPAVRTKKQQVPIFRGRRL